MPLPVIETERLLLRGWEDADAPALFALASDPAIGTAAGWPPHRSVEESLSVIREVLRAWESYAVVLRRAEPDVPAGALVGAVGLKDMRASEVVTRADEFEAGYWIGHPFWGRGFATEAMRALMAHAERDLHARRIWGTHYPENDRSRRVMEKCGLTFVREGSWRAYDADEEGGRTVRVLATPFSGSSPQEGPCLGRLCGDDLSSLAFALRPQDVLIRNALACDLGAIRHDEPEGIAVAMHADGTALLAAHTADAMRRARAAVGSAPVTVLPEPRFIEEARMGASEVLRFRTFVYEGAKAPEGSGRLRIEPLGVGHLDVVTAHYADLPAELIRRHLAAGWVLGGFDEAGELAGFIGEHTEGTMGMLTVLPEYRRRGYGFELEAAKIAQHLAQGRVPVAQVAAGNAASLALQRALGMRELPQERCCIIAS